MSKFSEIFKESLKPFGSPHDKRIQIENQRWEDRQKSIFEGSEGIIEQLDTVGRQADQLGGLRTNVLDSIETSVDRGGLRNRRGAALVAQQQLGDQRTGAVTHDDILSNSLRRAKARVGVATRGDAALRNQQLKDRLEQVRAGIRGQARAIDQQAAGQNIEAGVNLGVQSAKDRISASQAGLYGTIAGAVAGAGKNAWQNRQARQTTTLPPGSSSGDANAGVALSNMFPGSG